MELGESLDVGGAAHRSTVSDRRVGVFSVTLVRPGRKEKVTGKRRVFVAAVMDRRRMLGASRGERERI